jgi:predicted nucleotidyltransferase
MSRTSSAGSSSSSAHASLRSLRSAPELAHRLIDLVEPHPGIAKITLAGSRAEGRATELSDWDFLVDADDFAEVAAALPRLLAPLQPLAQQWDRLSNSQCWMLTLAGPTKVDLIFPAVPHTPEPAWEPAPDNLEAIDAHFWDWMLWLRAKHARGEDDLVANELERAFEHLLAPLGAERPPRSIAAAVEEYRAGRASAEARFGVAVDGRLEAAVAPALARMPG